MTGVFPRRGQPDHPTPSLPAAEVARFVVDQLQSLGGNFALLRDTLARSRQQSAQAIASLESELNALQCQLRSDYAELGKLDDRGQVEGPAFEELQGRIRHAETRVAELQQ